MQLLFTSFDQGSLFMIEVKYHAVLTPIKADLQLLSLFVILGCYHVTNLSSKKLLCYLVEIVVVHLSCKNNTSPFLGIPINWNIKMEVARSFFLGSA